MVMVRRHADPLAAWPHCASCTCAAPAPSSFVSEVRTLPVDLERAHTRHPKSSRPYTYKVADAVTWKPDRYHKLRYRLIVYDWMLDEGEASNVREAVKFLHLAHRRWLAEQAARDVERLRYLPRVRQRDGYTRGLARKRELILAEDRPCVYCRSPHANTIDHVMPWSRGGDHRRKNLVPACLHCNSAKGDKTPDEWRQWRLERGMCWPPLPNPCDSLKEAVR